MTKISPKKTWEGTIGGIILCIVVMIFIGEFNGFRESMTQSAYPQLLRSPALLVIFLNQNLNGWPE